MLEEDAWPLPESLVIMEFLEERYPEPALLPADPADRARRERSCSYRDGDHGSGAADGSAARPACQPGT